MVRAALLILVGPGLLAGCMAGPVPVYTYAPYAPPYVPPVVSPPAYVPLPPYQPPVTAPLDPDPPSSGIGALPPLDPPGPATASSPDVPRDDLSSTPPPGSDPVTDLLLTPLPQRDATSAPAAPSSETQIKAPTPSRDPFMGFRPMRGQTSPVP